jgi:hypothetical protein
METNALEYLSISTNWPVFLLGEQIKFVVYTSHDLNSSWRLELLTNHDPETKLTIDDKRLLQVNAEVWSGLLRVPVAGEYRLRIVDDKHSQRERSAETYFIVLEDKDYRRIWTEALAEPFQSSDDLCTLSTLTESVQILITNLYRENPLFCKINLNVDITINGRLGGIYVGMLPAISRLPFEWFHHNVLAAALALVFAGGTVAIDLLARREGLVGTVISTSIEGRMTERVPVLFEYLRLGIPGISLSFEKISEHQARILWTFPYRES